MVGKWEGKEKDVVTVLRIDSLILASHICFFCFFVFVFIGPHLWQMEVPRLGVYPELLLPAYTIAHGNAGSLSHWARPGIELATSWFLVGFVSAAPRRELLASQICDYETWYHIQKCRLLTFYLVFMEQFVSGERNWGGFPWPTCRETTVENGPQPERDLWPLQGHLQGIIGSVLRVPSSATATHAHVPSKILWDIPTLISTCSSGNFHLGRLKRRWSPHIGLAQPCSKSLWPFQKPWKCRGWIRCHQRAKTTVSALDGFVAILQPFPPFTLITPVS